MRHIALCLAAALGLGVVAAGAHPAHPFGDSWRWSHFSMRDGLPAPSAFGVLELADGSLWATTTAGLARYDGFQWHDTFSIPGVPRAVQGGRLIDLRDGRLAVLTGGVLHVGDATGFTTVGANLGPIEHAVLLDTGRFLILTRDSQLLQLEDDQATPVAPPEDVPLDQIARLTGSRDGSAWLHGDRSLYRFDAGHWVLEQQGRQFFHPLVTPSGRRYAAVEIPYTDRGLWSWTAGELAQQVYASQSDLAVDVAVSPAGQVVTVFESGDLLITDRQEQTLLSPGPPAFRSARNLAFTEAGDLLVTGDGVHLFRSVVVPWETWYTPDAGGRNRVDEILVTREGDVWLGTDGGVEIRRTDGTIRWMDEIDGVPLRIITGLAQDPSGAVWVGSGADWDGAYRVEDGNWTFVGHAQGLTASRLHRIESDPQGRVWFLGLSGEGAFRTQHASVVSYADGAFQSWTLPDSLGGSRVYDVAVAPDSTIWFGGVRGLARWRDGGWSRWDISTGLRTNKVFSLEVDDDGRLFFVDQRNGLGIIDADESIRYLDTRDGLIHSEGWDLTLGDDSTVWIATRGGLAGYRQGQWVAFGVDTGLPNLQLWPVAVDAAGRILVGTGGGGTAILDRSRIAQPAPRIAFLEPGVSPDEIVLRWRAHAWHRGLSDGHVPTRYRLDGGPWSPWSPEWQATFSSLDAGEHTLEVEGQDLFGQSLIDQSLIDRSNEGPGVDAGRHTALYRFTVPAPFYLRIGFLLPVGLLGIAVLALTVTQVRRRRQHAEALTQSESHFRSFFEEAPISLWEHDYSQLRDYLRNAAPADPEALRAHLERHPMVVFEAMQKIRVLLLNEATLRLFRAPDAATLVAQLHRVYRRSSFPAFREGMVAIMSGERRFSAQTTAYTLEGERREILLRWVVDPLAQNYSRVLVSVLDITAQHEAAEEMRQAARAAQEASRAKSAFLANTSHEIRTPINAIMGMAQALESESLPGSAREQVDTILQASEALSRIIDDLLDLSKIEAGELDLERVRFSLSRLLEEARRTVAGAADAKGLTFTARLIDGPDEVVGDPTRVRQILLNLCSNAIKFTDMGHVRVTLSSRLQEGRIRVDGEVADSGIGIPPDRVEEIFLPFTQADGSVTRTHGGTGLGLSICRRLVELMSGDIRAQSEPGVGSIFRFHVMLAEPTDADRYAREESDRPVLDEQVTPLRLLVAEDNEVNRRVVRALLKGDGHEMVEAEDGEQAVRMVRDQGRFDAILMDVQMPRMDGLTATGQIRSFEEETGAAHTPIIALTANAMEGDRERCLAAGMDDFLTKPVRKQALRGVLAQYRSQTTPEASVPPANDAAPPADEPAVLDPGPLGELRELEELDPDFTIAGFIQLFMDEAPQTLRDARQALADGDLEALHRHVHTLKGSAREIGAVRLGECALTWEQQFKAGDTTGAAGGLDELETLLDEAGAALERLVKTNEG